MQIESIIRRKGGTRVLLGTETYVFSSTPDDPREIAEVTKPADIQTLLAIKEGYCIADPVRPEPVPEGTETQAVNAVSAAVKAASKQIKSATITPLKPSASSAKK